MKLAMLLRFLVVLAFLANVAAQPEGRGIIGQKTIKSLQKIAEDSAGVVGLFVIDLKSGQTFSINGELVFPQGSAIKVPILLEVYKQASEGKFKLSDTITISADSQVGGSGVLAELSDGASRLSIRDLCILMILVSDNTATNILIDLVGMENVNQTLDSLGLSQTRLKRKMMDSEARARGDENVSTPGEAALLMQALYEMKFGKAVCEEILNILRKPKNGGFNSALPADVPVAFKPGGIPGVKTEWALVELPERPYVAVFMESYDRHNEADELLKSISRILYDYFWRLGNASDYGTFVDPKMLP